MTVDINSVVTLSYTLTNSHTGEQIEQTSPEHPMQFLYGIERVLPAFEEAIHGLVVGEKFTVSIVAAEAYGEPNNDQIATIPLAVFHDENGKMDDENVFVGALLPMTDSEGNHLRGTVKDITAEAVIMDFNHPLAGTDLKFDGEIIELRPATQDEISHGHSHGEHGHHH